MADCKDLINQFHNLEGVLLKEKKKSLHTLFKYIKASSPPILDVLIQELISVNYLEECLRIELLIYFKRTDDLLNVLVSGEEIGACKIIRQGWFIKELMEKFTPVQFVEVLIPKLSLSIRTKILKRILVYVKNETIIQELFGELEKTYGLNVAFMLLAGCSNEKIKKYLESNIVHLSATQLKLLFDKDKSIITLYFEGLKNDGVDIDKFKWRSVFSYIGIRDPVFLFEICEKFKIRKRKLGKKSTKKFVDLQRTKVVENPSQYFHSLRNDTLVRQLRDEFPKFYKNALPKKLEEFSHCREKSLLKYYVKGKQYELYFNTFQQLYNASLWDNTNYMDEWLIESIGDKEERDKWILKFEKRGNIKKYKIKKRCIKKCMYFAEGDMVAQNPIKEKNTIFNTLISSCKLTKDYDAFLNILKSFCERHRNSDVTILYNFLRTVHKDLDMTKLTDEHWKYIYEIITIQLFKKQQIFQPMFVEYIKFIYLQDKPIEESVRSLLKESPQNLSNFKYDDDKFERTMLQTYIKLLPECAEDNLLPLQIALGVIKWNQTHPTDIISIIDQPVILNSILKLKDSQSVESTTMKVLKYFICRQQGGPEVSDLDQMYWSNFNKLNNNTITTWFVKYKPQILKENLDKIGIMLKNKNISLVYNLKKYDHIGIPNEITRLCFEELDTCEASKRGRVIRILMLFIQRKDLINYVKQYIPKDDKLDVTGDDEKAKKLYEIQCAVGKYLKLTAHLKEVLPDLLKYCHGSILGSSLSSLYSSFCRIPESQLHSALEELSTKAVSVRKHAIFLSSLILSTSKVLLKYNQVQMSENNKSVKQHMFLSCYKYFLKNHLPECWPILEINIQQLNKQQKQVVKLLIDVNRVQKPYRAKFIECLWTSLYKLKNENTYYFENYLNLLLGNLRRNDIMILREEFSMDIVEHNLFDLEKCSMDHSVLSFARSFLLYGGNTEKKINFVFKILHSFKEKFWNNYEKKIDVLKIVNTFCFDLFEDVLAKDEHFDKNFPKLYRDAWVNEFGIEDTYEEMLVIDYILLKIESEMKTESLPEEINKAYALALGKYSNLIINSFKNFLTSFLRLLWKNDNYNIQLINFLDSLLEQNGSAEHCALVIELLPSPDQYLEEEAEYVFKKLIEKLSQKEEIVKIRLFTKLKSGY